MPRVDYNKQSEVYDKGRSMPDEAIAVWLTAARRHVHDEVSLVCDLGSGTGRFSAGLADVFDADVVAVEPSEGMRTQALTKPHSRVRVVDGSAESIPLDDTSADVVWMSNVIHHIDDPERALREIARVLRPTGTILIRGAFAGRNYGLSSYRFFPGAEKVIESFPSVADTMAVFGTAGFSSFYVERVTTLTANRLADMVDKVRQRADTTFELISDEEFEEGLAKLEAAAKVETEPIYDTLDLVVVR